MVAFLLSIIGAAVELIAQGLSPDWKNYAMYLGFALLGGATILYLYNQFCDPVARKLYLCLRYPYGFDNYQVPKYQDPSIAINLTPHDSTAPLRKTCHKDFSVHLVLGIANENHRPFTATTFKVKFSDPGIIVQHGTGWGIDDPNKAYIFNFQGQTVPCKEALNANSLTVTFPIAGHYTIHTSINGHELKAPLQNDFAIEIGPNPEKQLGDRIASGMNIYRVIDSKNTTSAATANSAYSLFGGIQNQKTWKSNDSAATTS